MKLVYACHDTLEALWIEASEPEKTFYQGILQISVALYHLENRNWRGAVILLGEGGNRLRRYPSSYGGVDVDELLSQSAALLTTLQQIGPDKIATGDLGIGPDKIATGDLGENQVLSLPKIMLSTD